MEQIKGADQILMAIPVTISTQELFARFDTTGRYGKLECAAIMTSLRRRTTTATAQHAACSVTGTRLVRRGLAEVCTLPVLLVNYFFKSSY